MRHNASTHSLLITTKTAATALRIVRAFFKGLTPGSDPAIIGMKCREEHMPADIRDCTETAAQHLVRKVPIADRRERVAAVLSRLPGSYYEAVDVVCVTDSDGRLCGIVV